MRFFYCLQWFFFLQLAAVEMVSIIIPCHPAHFPLLEELLTAYATQSVVPQEIVVSLSECEKIAPALRMALEQHSWPFTFRLLCHKQKYPAATNRKLAVAGSRGDLLLFQDADDLPHPRRVEIVKYIFEHQPVHHLVHSFVPDGGGFADYSTDQIPLVRSAAHLFFEGLRQNDGSTIPLHHGNVCMTRIVAARGQWRATYDQGEDVHFNIAALAQFQQTSYITPLRLILFRTHLSYFSNTPKEQR